MQMLDCYSLLSDRENALKWNKKNQPIYDPQYKFMKIKRKKI